MGWKEGSFAGASESAKAKHYQVISDNPNKLVVARSRADLSAKSSGFQNLFHDGDTSQDYGGGKRRERERACAKCTRLPWFR
jgi:hypothetical protein